MTPDTGPTKKYLTRSEAAAYLTEWGCRMTKNTLQKLATKGGEPLYRHNGKYVVYEPARLDEYLAKRMGPLQRSTSQIVPE